MFSAGKARPAFFTLLLDDLVKLPRVVSDDGVREQGQCTGDERELLAATPAVGSDRAVMDGSLQLMDRLAPHKKSVDAAPEVCLRGVIAQVDRTPELPELATGPVEARASAAEPSRSSR